MMITEKKWQQLQTWMAALDISENDISEQFILGSGSGGQKLHKTASTVLLQHAATGITIKCQQQRSRQANRYYARKRLCEKIDELQKGEQSKKQQAIEKIRRQKRRRSRRTQEKILEQKRQRAELKETRKKLDDIEDGNGIKS